jgi:multidrug transporter EmrE-like cation transporter
VDYGIHDFIGNLGVACVLGSYFLLSAGKMRMDQLAYPIVNGIGALLIGYSLLFDFNLSSMIIEVAWFSISVFGLARILRARREGRSP